MLVVTKFFAHIRSISMVLTHIDGTYYAMENRCPNQGGPLGKGSIETDKDGKCILRCPWQRPVIQEAASLQEEIARASGIADQHKQTISEIDHALKKLENGQYGVSEKLGEPIAYQTLSLIPWARTGIEN
jgi:hypothetical protein